MMPLKNTQMYMIGLKENKQIFDTVYWAPGTYERFMAILRDLTNSHPAHKPAVHIAQLRSEAKVPAHERLPGFQRWTQTQSNFSKETFLHS